LKVALNTITTHPPIKFKSHRWCNGLHAHLEFVIRLGRTKDYKIGNMLLLWARGKTGWLRIRIICLSGVSDMSIHILLFHWASTIKTRHVDLVQSRYSHHLIEMQLLAMIWLKNCSLVLNNNHPLTIKFNVACIFHKLMLFQ
jgi:hypothetical protein